MIRVGWDLDGVLYDFGNSVRRYLDSIGRNYGWMDGHTENHIWNFHDYWHMDREEFTQICHDGADAGYIFCGPVRDNAVDAMSRSKDLGFTNVIITDRFFGSSPEVSHENTQDWLRMNGFDYDELHFSPDKTIVPTDFFVEDKLANYDALVAAGTHSFLINRAWNEVQGGDTRNRINDVSEYADALEKIAAQGFADFTIA